VDSTSNIAETFAHIKANCINVAVGLAAAILNVSLCAIETIFEAVVDSIEAITESIGNTTELSVYILVVETFEKVGAGESTLYCGIASTISTTEETTAAENRKPYKVDKPLCYEIADSAISLYITIKSRLYLLLKEKSCTSD
jgi:hypothetical protein